MPRLDLRFVTTFAFAAMSLAQGVPYGAGVVSVTNNIAPSEGLWLVDRSGASTAITGLIAAGSLGNGVNAVQIDPIDGRIWLGGINSGGDTSGQVNWIRISGSLVTQFAQHATVPTATPASIAAITFDDNGNPIVAASTASNGGGVFRVDRKNGGAAVLIGVVASGAHNALCRDDAGNLYVGMSNGQVHVLTKNGDGSYQPPAPFGTVSSTNISGITFVPSAGGATGDELWISTLGLPSGNNLFRMPIAGGAGVVANAATPSANWIECDRRHDDLLLLPNTAPRSVVQVDRASAALTTLASPQGGGAGVTTCVDVDDAADTHVAVAPQYLNGAVGPFDLELGVTSPPGSIAVIGVSSPSIVLGWGVVGPSGRFSLRIPNVLMPAALPPGALAFLAASLAIPSGALTIGPPRAWPAN